MSENIEVKSRNIAIVALVSIIVGILFIFICITIKDSSYREGFKACEKQAQERCKELMQEAYNKGFLEGHRVGGEEACEIWEKELKKNKKRGLFH